MLLKNMSKQSLVLRKSHREVKQVSIRKGVQAGRTEPYLLVDKNSAVNELCFFSSEGFVWKLPGDFQMTANRSFDCDTLMAFAAFPTLFLLLWPLFYFWVCRRASMLPHPQSCTPAASLHSSPAAFLSGVGTGANTGNSCFIFSIIQEGKKGAKRKRGDKKTKNIGMFWLHQKKEPPLFIYQRWPRFFSWPSLWVRTLREGRDRVPGATRWQWRQQQGWAGFASAPLSWISVHWLKAGSCCFMERTRAAQCTGCQVWPAKQQIHFKRPE